MKQLEKAQLALVVGGAQVMAGVDGAESTDFDFFFASESGSSGGGGGGSTTISVSGGGINSDLLGFGAAITAIGAAIGADAAITTAGGLGVASLGITGSIAGGSTIGGGYGAAAWVGYQIGTATYNNSETVQGTAQNMVERFLEGPIDAVVTGVGDIWDMITGQGSYAPPAGAGPTTGNGQNTLVVPR